MKLKQEDKEELRLQIQGRLTNIENGDKVHIKKDLLESLLFEVVTVDKEKKVVVKLPVWSGEFLKKIDLSEVDFSDVSWCILGNDEFKIDFNDLTITSNSVYDEIRKINNNKKRKINTTQNKFFVDFSGTNANIDLTESYEAKHGGYIELKKCNFAGLDFSKIELDQINELILLDSNISNTKISIPSEMNIKANGSSFENIDLSSRTINEDDYIAPYGTNFSNSNLCNTGIKIMINSNSFLSSFFKLRLKEAMANDWVGCYVNGKKILSSEEQATKKRELLEQYEQMKNKIFVATLENIDEQARQKKKVFNNN